MFLVMHRTENSLIALINKYGIPISQWTCLSEGVNEQDSIVNISWTTERATELQEKFIYTTIIKLFTNHPEVSALPAGWIW